MFKTIRRCKASVLGLCSALLLSSFLSASPALETEASEKDIQNLRAAAGAPANTQKQNRIRDSWKPYLDNNHNLGDTDQYFFTMNVGIGFLRFDQITGGPASILNTTVLRTSRMSSSPVVNKSPLIEASLGANLTSFMGLGLSFLNQSNIFYQSYMLAKTRAAVPRMYLFTADINLNAAVAKLYFYLPYSMVWKALAYSPYLSVSAGPSWQTWRNLQLTDKSLNLVTVYTQKVSANCFFGTELGLQIRSLVPNLNLSLLMGCKFNIWGQARSMGKADQQKQRSAYLNSATGQHDFLLQPYRIKTVYQWAPFLGLVWSY